MPGTNLGLATTAEGVEALEQVQRVIAEGCTQPRLPHWSMAFVGNEAEVAERHAGLAAESGFDPGHRDGETLFTMRHELVLEEETQAV